MRKLTLLFAIGLLFQSCFSYRIDTKPSEMIVGKTYKIERNHKTIKATVKSINDSAVVVTKRNFEEKQIPINEITQARKRKFSIVKTVLLPTAVVAAITGIVIAAYSGPTLGPINMFN